MPETKVVRRELAGVPKVEVVGLSKEKVEETVLGHHQPGQGRAGRESQGNRFPYIMRQMERNRHCDSTFPPLSVMMTAWIDMPWNGSATTS